PRADRAQARSAPIPGLLASASKFGSLDRASVERRSGLDLSRPIWLAWYAEAELPRSASQSQAGLLAAIPWSGKLQTAAAFVTGLLDGEDLRAELVSNRAAVSLRVPGWAQRAFFLCSGDYLYLCGSLRVAEALAGAGGRFASEPLAKIFLPANPPDLQAAASMALLKSYSIPASRDLEAGLKEYVSSLSNSLATMGVASRGNLSRVIQRFLGIASPEEAVAVVDCLLAAVSSELLPELRWALANLHGLSLSLDFAGERQKIQATLYRTTAERGGPGRTVDLSSEIQKALGAFNRPEAKAGVLPAPIPMEPVRQAIASVPGSRETLLIQGRGAVGEGPVLLARVVARAASNAEARGVAWPFLSRARDWLTGWQHTPPLESRLPWTLSFRNEAQAAPVALSALASPLERRWGQALARWNEPWTTLFPSAQAGAPERYLGELAAAQTARERSWDRLWNGELTNRKLLASSSRMRVERPVGRANALVYEDVIATRFGLFGYDQHELVNRRHYFLRPQGEYTYLQKTREPSKWLTAEAPPECRAPDPGLLELLGAVPEGAHFVVLDRRLQQILPMLDELGALEDAVHAEVHAFLAKAQKVVDEAKGDDTILRQRAALLEPPVYITELRLDESSKVHCGVGGKTALHFPRPRLIAPLRELFRDAPAAGLLPGGMAFSYGAYADRHEIVLQQDLRGLSRLWRDAAKQFWKQYPGPDAGAKASALVAALGLQGGEPPGALIASWTPDAYGLGGLVKILDKLK
ncbi:MAG: hypothetical protein J0L75_20295, partial [Spirochaetes bacterium]|nr:hypothetical protein [Spirochaetota bacterium]